jgi:tetratricopeptide (TPR) repeat protein
MANAQFHKGDFQSASATSQYIMRHFAYDPKTSSRAAILLARSYKELNLLYEAEQVFNNLDKTSLPSSLTGSFSAAYADFLLARKQYETAIPYLKIAIKHAPDKRDKQRWTFLLGQLYQQSGQRREAEQTYASIPNLNPPYEMEISARIRQTEVNTDPNPEKPLKKLRRLSHSKKNTDYLDQIYYAMGQLVSGRQRYR